MREWRNLASTAIERIRISVSGLIGSHPPDTLPAPTLELHQPGPQAAALGKQLLLLDLGTANIAAGVWHGVNQLNFIQFRSGATAGWALLHDSNVWIRQRGADVSPSLAENCIVVYGPDVTPMREIRFPKRHLEFLAATRPMEEWLDGAIRDVAGLCIGVFKRSQVGDRAWMLDNEEAWELRPDEVWLAVPNTFPDEALHAFREGVAFGITAALRLDKLAEVRCMKEASAVASLYLKDEPPRDGFLLVLDSGAGTTDVAVINMEDKSVVASVGVPVGGSDLDKAILASDPAYRGDGQSSDLLRARGAKHIALSESTWPASTSVNLGDFPFLAASQDPELRQGRAALVSAWKRWIALSVRALVTSLPLDILQRVRVVAYAGQSSQVNGVPDALQEILRRTPHPVANDALGLKLAVVAGMAEFKSRQLDPTPARSGMGVTARFTESADIGLVALGEPISKGGVSCTLYATQGVERSERVLISGLRLSPSALSNGRVREDLGPFYSHTLKWNTTPLGGVDATFPGVLNLSIDPDRGIVRYWNESNQVWEPLGASHALPSSRHPVSGWTGDHFHPLLAPLRP